MTQCSCMHTDDQARLELHHVKSVIMPNRAVCGEVLSAAANAKGVRHLSTSESDMLSSNYRYKVHGSRCRTCHTWVALGCSEDRT